MPTYRFHRIRNNISDNCNFLRLAYAIHSINCLCFYHRVPMRLYQMHYTSSRQINPRNRFSQLNEFRKASIGESLYPSAQAPMLASITVQCGLISNSCIAFRRPSRVVRPSIRWNSSRSLKSACSIRSSILTQELNTTLRSVSTYLWQQWCWNKPFSWPTVKLSCWLLLFQVL